jgi:hypothetical protein
VSWPRFIFFGFLVFAILLPTSGNAEKKDRDEPMAAAENNLEARVLNVPVEAVNAAGLKTASTKIMNLWREEKLIPTRVEIFHDHPIVKEALAAKTIQITTSLSDSPAIIFVPLSHGGKRIIVQKRAGSIENYGLFSLPDGSGVDLTLCLKR